MSSIKKIKTVYNSRPQQVGDGFVGKNAISTYNYKDFSPFLMLDHHGPMQVKPSNIPKGVDEHPHRGIETITVVFEGALQHRDSAGNKGVLYAGDMQWMTAASGIVHEEKHEIEFSKKGGILNFIQLWTNLPAKLKMTEPNYQEITAASVPVIDLAEGVKLRVLAGELAGIQGSAKTNMPLILGELQISQKSDFELKITEGFNIGLYIMSGQVAMGKQWIPEGKIIAFENEGDTLHILTDGPAHLLVLGGEPINEPIVAHGPFVMNTEEEIIQTIKDYQMGKMGHLN